jgi:hypothetical protein
MIIYATKIYSEYIPVPTRFNPFSYHRCKESHHYYYKVQHVYGDTSYRKWFHIYPFVEQNVGWSIYSCESYTRVPGMNTGGRQCWQVCRAFRQPVQVQMASFHKWSNSFTKASYHWQYINSHAEAQSSRLFIHTPSFSTFLNSPCVIYNEAVSALRLYSIKWN